MLNVLLLLPPYKALLHLTYLYGSIMFGLESKEIGPIGQLFAYIEAKEAHAEGNAQNS
jgi:hypothetical protein